MLKAKIIKYSKLLYEKGLNLAMSGNISILHDKLVYITPHGMFKSYLRPEDISIIRLDGEVLNNIQPSAEYRMHLEIYRERKDISSIIHSHCFYSSIIGLLPLDFSDFRIFSESLISIGLPARTNYYMPSSAELAKKVAEAMKASNVVFMANNGVTAAGGDIVEAYCRIESAEFYARAVCFLRKEPDIKKISKAEAERLLNLL